MKNIKSELINNKVFEHDAGEVFSGSKSGSIVKGYEKASSYTPDVDKNYIFHDESRDLIVWFLGTNEPLYVYGPTGCGKTSCIKQLAARLNYPIFEATGHSKLEFPELVGHLTVKNGSMEYEYGPLALAIKYGGLFLINEMDLLEPSTAAGLNSVLDGQSLCITENGGELLKAHPMFRFVATANTNGANDETGLYQGTLRQNIAMMDRFSLCQMNYPEAKTEEILLAKYAPKIPTEIRNKMVDYANEVRKLFMGDEEARFSANSIEITFSTRSLLRWADLTVRYQPLAKKGIKPIEYALDRALAFRACPSTRAMLHELVQRIFPNN